MANDSVVRKFVLASKQRLTSAELLLEHGMHLDAMYLAGYGVECALKAVLLARTPPNKRQQLIDASFRGSAAHNFESLKQQLQQRAGIHAADREVLSSRGKLVNRFAL